MGFHLENCPRGGCRRNLEGGGGGQMIKDVAEFHKCHLGGQGMLVCCLCGVTYRIFSFGRGGGGGGGINSVFT